MCDVKLKLFLLQLVSISKTKEIFLQNSRMKLKEKTQGFGQNQKLELPGMDPICNPLILMYICCQGCVYRGTEERKDMVSYDNVGKNWSETPSLDSPLVSTSLAFKVHG